MKKIEFNKLIIKNFRNIKELEIDFNSNTTEIIGENGLGKTNTLSAITWCLFGKNIDDNKQFAISPIINGVEDNSALTTVKMVLNGTYVVERSYKDRKTSLRTGWIIDDKENLVNITQTNYSKELEEQLVNEETFKSLSNITYVPNLNWKDLKKLIFDLIGDIKDDEVLIRDNFTLIEQYVRKFGIEQAQKLLKETDAQLKDDIKRLETEYQTLKATKEKYVADETENQKLVARKEEIEKQLYDYETNIKALQEKILEYNNKQTEIEKLKLELNRLNNQLIYCKNAISEYDDLYKQNSFNAELLREKEVKEKQYEIDNLERQMQQNDTIIVEQQKELERIKEQGNNLKQKEIKIENETCSTCGQRLPEEKIQEILNKLKEQQISQLQELKNKYDSLQASTKLLEEKREKLIEEQKNCIKQLEEIKNKGYEVIDETEKQKKIRILKEEKELEVKELESKFNSLSSEINAKTLEFNSLEKPVIVEDDNLPLKLELNEINDKLATTITLNKLNEDVESALKELNSKKGMMSLNKEKINEVIKFNNVKADLLQKKVRSYFEIVNFRTKEFTIDGQEVETFKITNSDGVEFKEVNTAQKIQLGLDLLKGIMKAKEIYTPVIIDGVEVLTSDLKNDVSQLIITRAIKGINKLEVK